MSLKTKIEEVLDSQVKPALEADGGSIQLVDVTDDGVVQVMLTGACGSCPMAQMTLKMHVEKTLKRLIPEVKEVVSV